MKKRLVAFLTALLVMAGCFMNAGLGFTLSSYTAGSTDSFSFDSTITTVVDNLDDWSKSDTHSSGWAFDTGNLSFFENDPSRSFRLSSTVQNITYHYSRIVDFTAKLYFCEGLDNKVKVYTSPNSSTWTELEMKHDTPLSIAGAWQRANFYPAEGIPFNTNYIKIEFVDTTGANYNTELGQVTIEHLAGQTPLDIAKATDNMDVSDWSMSFSHTDGWTYDTGNVNVIAEGDASRVYRLADAPQNIIYNYNDMTNFSAKLLYFGLEEGTVQARVKIYTSPDNSAWTELLYQKDTSEKTLDGDGDNDWYRTNISPATGIPAGTNYLKIEFLNTDGNNWHPQLSQVSIYYTRGMTDYFNNWSKVSAHTDGWAFDTGNSELIFGGDASRAYKTAATTQSIEYNFPGINNFYLKVFYLGLESDTLNDRIKIYTSGNGTTWDSLSMTKTNTAATSAGWFKADITPAENIPAGTNYIKVELPKVDGNDYNPELSQLYINYGGSVPATGISLDKTTLRMGVGGAETLSATVAPSDASNKSVIWSTANASVASVSGGTVTGIAPGTTTITAVSVDGSYSAACTVSVLSTIHIDNLNDFSMIESKTDNWALTGTNSQYFEGDTGRICRTSENTPQSITYNYNDIIDFTARVYSYGPMDGPAESPVQKLKAYTSTNGAVWVELPVQHDTPQTTLGEFVAANFIPAAEIPEGTNFLKIELLNDANIWSPLLGKVVIEQAASIPVSEVQVNRSNLYLQAGETGSLTAKVLPVSASDKRVTWSSSNNSIATVENGVVTAVSEGNATISAITVDGSYTATCNVHVKPLYKEIDFLNDWGKVYSHSFDWVFDTSKMDTGFFADDTSRITRTANTPQNVIYKCEGVVDFKLNLFYYEGLDGRVKVYTSPDNSGWTLLKIAHNGDVNTAGSWYRTVFTPDETIPWGTKYLKIEFSSLTVDNAWSPELSQVEIIRDLKPISSFEAVNVVTATEVAPVLPQYVRANYADGSHENLKVSWNNFDASSYNTAGSFAVNGRVGTETLAANVTVADISSFAAVNVVTAVNSLPLLPARVTATLSNSATMPLDVTWAGINPSQYSQVGSFTVTGNAGGRSLTANVTVQESAASVDGNTTFQAIGGWGGQWVPFGTNLAGPGLSYSPGRNEKNSDYVLTSVLPELGVKYFRTDVSWPKQAEETHRDYNWYLDEFQKPEFNYLWAHFEKMRELGVEVIPQRWNAPARIEFAGDTSDANTIDENYRAKYQEIADFYAAICKVAELKGYDVSSLLIFNEINSNWSTHLTPQQYVRLVKTIGATLSSKGITDIKIIGPDTWYAYDLPAYVDALTLDTEAMSYMRGFDTHAWEDYTKDSATFNIDTGIPELEEAARIARDRGYGHIPFYIPEFGTFKFSNYANAYVAPGSASNTDSYEYAFYTCERMQKWLSADAPVSYIFNWDSFDYITDNDTIRPWGMRKSTREDWAARPIYNTTYNFYKYIKPGSERIQVNTNDSDLLCTAYKNNGKVTIVLLNRNEAVDKTINLNLTNLSVGSLDLITTDKSESNKYVGALTVSGGNVSVTIPAKGIATLTNMGTVTVRSISDSKYKDVYKVDPGASIQLAANVAGGADNVTWSVIGGSSKGTITSGGLYRAPASSLDEFVIVKAVSSSDSSNTGYAFIKVGGIDNISAGKTLSSSSERNASNTSAKAADGNNSTEWNSTSAGAIHWLKVDLGGAYDINRILIKHAGASKYEGVSPDDFINPINEQKNTRDFKIQTSADNSSWVDIDTVTGNTGDITDRTVSGNGTTRVRYVRLYITDPSSLEGDNTARIHEFEVYGMRSSEIIQEAPTPVIPSIPVSIPGPTASPVPIVENGTVRIVQNPVADQTTGAAKTSITPEILEDAFQKAETGSKGIRKVTLEIPKIEGVKDYLQELPKEAFDSKKQDSSEISKIIEIKTPVGTVLVTDNMFGNNETGKIQSVGISIGLADISGLKKDISSIIGNRPVIELNVLVDGKVVAWKNKEAPVQVTVDYTPTAEELKNPEGIVVWYIDGSGKVNSVPNGKFDPKTGKVTFSTTHFSKYAVAYNYVTFKDAGKYKWAQKQIEVLASKGIIGGVTQAEFRPEMEITRAEFMDSLIKAMGISAEFEGNFADIKKTDTYYESVGIAKKLGITGGTGNNKFSPNAKISRQEMAAFVVRAMKLAKADFLNGTAADLKKYSDTSKIAKYAIEDMSVMVSNGIITANGNKLNPTGKVTRAQTAVIMYRLYNK